MPALRAIIGADARPFERELSRVEGTARTWTRRVTDNMRGGTAVGTVGVTGKTMGKNDANAYVEWWGKTLDEKRAKLGEAPQKAAAAASSSFWGGMRRAKGMGGASTAMFVSVARDSAASLASGANPATIAMQQGPQLIQAFTMMGLSIKSVIAAAAPFAAVLVSLTNVALLAREAYKASKAKEEEALTGFAAEMHGTFSGAVAIKNLSKERDRMEPGEADQLISDILGSTGDKQRNVIDYVVFRLKQVRANDPTKEQIIAAEKLEELQKNMFLASMSGIEKERTMARLAYDERKKQIEELAKVTGTSNDTHRAYRLAENEFLSTMRAIDSRGETKPSGGIRFGSRVELPPGQREMQQHVREIAGNVKTIATRSTPSQSTVKF